MSRAAMQQALEALEWVWGGEPLTGKELDAITALRQALAEPEQQPVAHSVVEPLRPDDIRRSVSVKWVGQPVSGPLYTAPTPRKPQREHITDGSPCWCNPDVIEEEGGNVIVHNYEDNWQQYAKPGETAQQCIERHRAEQDALMKLYANPRKPVELTDEECDAIYDALDDWAREFDSHEFGLPRICGGGAEGGRAVIRRAHGITGEQT